MLHVCESHHEKSLKLTTLSFNILVSCFLASLVLSFGPVCHKMFLCWTQTQFLQLALMLFWINQNWKYSCIKWNHMKDGNLIIQGNWEIWEPRQVQVESIVTAALWCILKHFPLSDRNRISKYFFTGACEFLTLSNRSLTWNRLKLAVPVCKFYLYIWKSSFLWAPQDRKTFSRNQN